VDIGADIWAAFSVGQLTTVPVRVQVKYWRGVAGREPIDQLSSRPVRWLNDGKPIPRTNARAPLIARMPAYGTVSAASDLVEEIEDTLASVSLAEVPTRLGSLRQRLIAATKEELQTGYLDERRFESLVRDLLLALGPRPGAQANAGPA